MRLSFAAFVFVSVFGTAAPATTLALTFDGSDCANDGQPTRSGPIHWDDPNFAAYGDCDPSILLGDDGWSETAGIYADPGTRFDLTRFDLSGGYDIRRARLSSHTDLATQVADLLRDVSTRVEGFPFLRVTGFRAGLQVASALINPARVSTYAAPAAFSDLDRVVFGLPYSANRFPLYGATWVADGYLYTCALARGLQCGSLTYDNVALTLRDDPAAVPLPAAGGLLAVALAGLGLWRRRSKSTL
jgi:hypothetical protein